MGRKKHIRGVGGCVESRSLFVGGRSGLKLNASNSTSESFQKSRGPNIDPK